MPPPSATWRVNRLGRRRRLESGWVLRDWGSRPLLSAMIDSRMGYTHSSGKLRRYRLDLSPVRKIMAHHRTGADANLYCLER